MGGLGFKFGPYEMRGTLEGLGNTLQEERDKFLQDKLLKLHQVEYALENAPRAAFQALPAFGVAAGPFSFEKASPSSLFDDRYLAKQQPPPVGIKEAQEALNKRRVSPNLDAPWEGPPVAAAEVEPPPRPGYSVMERDGKRVFILNNMRHF